jgi:folate-binding protein YgfZ
MSAPSTNELQHILQGAATAPLTDRAFLRITGPDATRWLNGMATNNIKDLAPGEGNYNFFLNAQGRIQGDAIIYREPAATSESPSYLFVTQAAQAEKLLPVLDRFIIMDDVELTPAATDETSLLLLGPQAPAALQALGLPALEPLRYALADTSAGPVTALTPTPTSIPLLELRAPAAIAATLHKRLAESGLPQVSAEALEQFRILTGTPRYGTDIRNTETAKDLPQETNQHHALHFAKGCYLGQEIVERIRSRGQVHRLFTKLELTGDLPTNLPAPLESNGKPAGEITSAALVPLPDGDKLLALGYVRREALDLHQPLTYAGGTATPRD